MPTAPAPTRQFGGRVAKAVLLAIGLAALDSSVVTADSASRTCRRGCSTARRACLRDVRTTLRAAIAACVAAPAPSVCRTDARAAGKAGRIACSDFGRACRACCGAAGVDCAARCGDGIVQPSHGETCDPPGGTTGCGGDVCDDTCRCPVPSTTSSTGPITTTTSTTSSTSLPPTVCGNGLRELPEGCDDGNAQDDDGCRSDCTPSSCAGGIIDPHEGCDATGDACTVLPPTCSAAGAACSITATEVADVVGYLADDAQEGRNNLTPASVRVQDFLIERLQTFAVGAAPGGGFRQPFANGTNILARIPGGNPAATEAVVVGAHYDHLGRSGATIYNGATDNAGGVAAVMAVGRALSRLPVPLPRPVILALWDAEEDALLGSGYYVGHPAVPIVDTIAYVNFDIVGSSTAQGFRRQTFAVGVDSSSAFPALVDELMGGDAMVIGPFSTLFGQNRSDHVAFVAAGVPVLFFSDSTGGCYHTPGDDVANVHFGKVLRTAWLGFRFVTALATAPGRPGFTPTQALPTFTDAVTLHGVLDRGLCNAAASGATPAQVATVQGMVSTLAAIIANGPAAFTGNDAVTVGLTALDAIDILLSLPCQAN